MKNLLICLILTIFSLFSYSQEVKSSKVMVFPTEQKAIGKGATTTYWKTVKGTKCPIYKSERGSFYFITKLPTGEFKRNYIKI